MSRTRCALALTLTFMLSTALPADDAKTDKSRKATVVGLPVKQVVLFNNGVGYFQREGQVEGDARVDLQFPVANVNDLLKSLVLKDMNGGKISTIHYDSPFPIETTLKTFAIDLNGDPSLGQLLKQARGEKVEVAVVPEKGSSGGTTTLTGMIIGMERKQGETGDMYVEQLNLLTGEGVRGIPMTQVQRFRFLRPEMEQDFRKALDVLASTRDQMRKTVSLNFNGKGKRDVRVGYVVANPMWKPTYRVSVEKDKVTLQGWAIVENTTEEDWKEIKLNLVAARPITYQMDLYEPLFVKRPVVEPDVFASLRPPSYQGSLLANPFNGQGVAASQFQNPMNLAGVPGAFSGNQLGSMGWNSSIQGNTFGQLGGQFGGFGGAVPFGQLGQAPPGLLTPPDLLGEDGKPKTGTVKVKSVHDVIKTLDTDTEDGEGLGAGPKGVDLGQYFIYKIDEAISLPRQKSAMIPIVSQEIKADKVSIFNSRVHSKHPLHGLKVKNSTPLTLMQGSCTVYDESTYAGDSQLPDLKPNELRLLSYAVDLGTEVVQETKGLPESLISVKIVKGTMVAVHKTRSSTIYTIKNRSDEPQKIVIEHPYDPHARLVTPEKVADRTRDAYRFEVVADTNKPTKLEVVLERKLEKTVRLSPKFDQSMELIVKSSETSPQVKEALQKAMTMSAALSDINRSTKKEEDALKVIEQDQARMRANMEQVPAQSEAYKRYLKKFDVQETDIEQRREKIAKLQESAEAKTKELQDYLLALNVE